jgi:hypothetical protein
MDVKGMMLYPGLMKQAQSSNTWSNAEQAAFVFVADLVHAFPASDMTFSQPP